MRTRALLAALALVVLAGCGSEAGITRGGTIIGDTLTVYSMLPQPSAGVSRDILDGEKLALAEAGGRAGGFGINFVSLDEGAEDPAETVSRAASASRDAISDPQIIAVIDALDSATAMTTVPLFNAAGILQIAPGAGYPGLTSPAAPGEPERYQPAGVPTFARVVGDDRDQAAALVAAAIAEAGPRPSVAIQAEPGPEAAALAAAVRARLRARGARVVASPARADAVVYAGSDAGKAAQAAGAGAGGAFILPDAVVRTGVAARLSPAARRRAVLVSRAPRPGTTPALRRFEATFAERLGRRPGPYAALGYEAMRSVLWAVERAGADANRRSAVIDAFFRGPDRGWLLGRWRTRPDGRRTNPGFSAVRARDGAPVASRDAALRPPG